MLSKKCGNHYKTMQTYCLICTTNTDSVDSKKVTMANKVGRQTSRCTNCVGEKSSFSKQKPNKKTWLK